MGTTTQIAFRTMTPEDASEVAALDAKCFGEHDAWSCAGFFYAAHHRNSKYIVAEFNGQIIGCAGVEFLKDCAEVQTLAIDPNYRGLGLGRQLFTKLLATVIERGLRTIILEVRPSNMAAVKLYESFGFQVVDRLENFYEDEDALIMLRDL